MTHLVVTLIAPARPGLVEGIAQCIAQHQGNWLDSRMARMDGQFAGIVRIAVAPEHRDGLSQALRALERLGISLQIADSGQPPSQEVRELRLALVGNDRPGIIRDITRRLAELSVNLESLETEVQPAPMSGEPLFHARALLALPASLSQAHLQERLEELADELMVELTVPR